MHWLYQANTKFYDVFGAFEEAATYWPLNSKVSVGDTVFIYLAAPHKQIAFACDVLDVGLEESEVIEFVRPFFKGENHDEKPQKLFMKLQVSSSIPLGSDSPLAYEYLKQSGLSGMLMGPRKLENNPALLSYIERKTS